MRTTFTSNAQVDLVAAIRTQTQLAHNAHILQSSNEVLKSTLERERVQFASAFTTLKGELTRAREELASTLVSTTLLDASRIFCSILSDETLSQAGKTEAQTSTGIQTDPVSDTPASEPLGIQVQGAVEAYLQVRNRWFLVAQNF